MLPYLVISSIVVFTSFLDITNFKNNKIVYFLLFTILVVFIGSRDQIGTDWWIYEKIFTDKDSAELVEPGYKLIQFFVKWIFGNNYYSMVFCIAFISLAIKFKAFANVAPLWAIAILYYFGYYYVPQEANQIRQGLAAGILVFSVPFLAKKENWKFFGTVLLATLFHYTAIIFLTCFIVQKYRNIKLWMTFIAVLFFSSFMFIDLMGFFQIIISNVVVKILPIPTATDKLLFYINSRYAEAQGFYLGSLFLFFFTFLFGFYRKKINSNIYNVFYICFVFGVCLNFFFNSFAVLGRLTFHFILLGAVLYSYVVKYEKRILVKVLLIFILAVISVSKVYNYVNSEKAHQNYLPYKSTLLKW